MSGTTSYRSCDDTIINLQILEIAGGSKRGREQRVMEPAGFRWEVKAMQASVIL